MQAKILDALRRGAHPEALSLARLAVAEAPHDAAAHALLAQAARASGDIAGAHSAISRAVLLAPEDAGLHYQRAGFLLGERKINEAQAALNRSLDLDPNQYEPYVLQAQLALGKGDMDEANRLFQAAQRLSPEHPWTQMLEGQLAGRLGDGARAQRLLMQAAARAPNDAQILYALGFAHLQQGQLAFAEQAFQHVIRLNPAMQGLRGLIADVMIRQNRPQDARQVLQPLLDDPATATPPLKRMTAELELAMGRPQEAMALLKAAIAEDPREPGTLRVLTQLWRMSGDFDDARSTIDTALEKAPANVGLWQLRLAFEPEASDAAQAVIERWLAANPEQPAALDAQMHLYEALGRRDEAEALAWRIVDLEPGRSSAEMRVLQQLLRTDPAAAVERVRALIAHSRDEASRQGLLPWLGYAQDCAGDRAEALRTWNVFNAAQAPRRWPLPPASAAAAPWPTASVPLPNTPPVAYLAGLPGSGVERVAAVIANAGYPLRADRFGPNAPRDPLQNPDTAVGLAKGTLSPGTVLEAWRAALPARGIRDGIVIDWLPAWDNGLLKLTRPLQPEAIVVVALRDPRDMLLDWLCFGGGLPFGLTDPVEAARWMAGYLAHAIELNQDALQPHALIRTDHAMNDVEAFAAQIGGALGLEQIRVPHPAALGAPRFAPGHWRHYAQLLGPAFAVLAEPAMALGYPAE